MVRDGMILVLITVAVVPIAAISFARSGKAWRSLGKGRFAIEPEPPPKSRPGQAPSAAERAAQAAEVRQMVEAKSYRRQRRGEEGLDVEEEVGRVLSESGAVAAPGEDAELREEVRQLVIARNERRARHGEEPLDVEEEVERQLADL